MTPPSRWSWRDERRTRPPGEFGRRAGGHRVVGQGLGHGCDGLARRLPAELDLPVRLVVGNGPPRAVRAVGGEVEEDAAAGAVDVDASGTRIVLVGPREQVDQGTDDVVDLVHAAAGQVPRRDEDQVVRGERVHRFGLPVWRGAGGAEVAFCGLGPWAWAMSWRSSARAENEARRRESRRDTVR